ncbi:MAG: hypothetical protein M1840_006780 [Geoglossum simile]|nr:MAG: hypothetical protein M1840_006780 [Geoglossum simile]
MNGVPCDKAAVDEKQPPDRQALKRKMGGLWLPEGLGKVREETHPRKGYNRYQIIDTEWHRRKTLRIPGENDDRAGRWMKARASRSRHEVAV